MKTAAAKPLALATRANKQASERREREKAKKKRAQNERARDRVLSRLRIMKRALALDEYSEPTLFH